MINDRSTLPVSQRMYPLLGLNLLCLLSQQKIAEFHMEIELLDIDVVFSNIYIKHPVTIEQCLMEGSYNKIWLAKANVPAEDYLFFMEILESTIRKEIGACCEVSYKSLPIADLASLLYFKTPQEVAAFCSEVNMIF